MKTVREWILTYDTRFGTDVATLLDSAENPAYTEATALQKLMEQEGITKGHTLYDDEWECLEDEGGNPIYGTTEEDNYEYFFEGDEATPITDYNISFRDHIVEEKVRFVSGSTGKKASDDIREIAYNRYQFHWLMDNGFNMRNIFDAAADIACELAEDADITGDAMETAFEESGLGSGSIYVCKDEFLKHEYLEIDYMRQILTEEQFAAYKQDRKLTGTDLIQPYHQIVVDTPHGFIVAKSKENSEYPGIETFFVPEGQEPYCGNYPGCVMEFNPTYRGGVDEPGWPITHEQVVMWVYGKDEVGEEPQATASFEME